MLVLGSVEIKQTANHFLILRMMLFCFLFKKVDAGFAQPNGDLDLIFFERQLIGRGKKILHYFHVINRSICVFIHINIWIISTHVFPGLTARLDRRMEQLKISEHLRAARKAAGMTQKEVAEQMNVARTRISKLESQPQNITLETLMRYTEAVGANFSMNIGSARAHAAMA